MKHHIPLIAFLITSPAFAEGSRELDAHEHGVGALNIAIDGQTIAMEFRAPGADIVGFEYAAKSAEDRAAIDNAVATLAKPLDLFVFPEAVECNAVQASAELELEGEHDDHDHEEDHDDHDEDHTEKHDEHEHDDDHADAHDDHDDHEHEDHADAEASHTEFHAEYTLACGNPAALTGIDFAYFATFENARELEVQVVTASGAQAFEVVADDPSLDLRGLF